MPPDGAPYHHQIDGVIRDSGQFEETLGQKRLEPRDDAAAALTGRAPFREGMDHDLMPERLEGFHHLVNVDAFGAVGQRAMVIENSHRYAVSSLASTPSVSTSSGLGISLEMTSRPVRTSLTTAARAAGSVAG